MTTEGLAGTKDDRPSNLTDSPQISNFYKVSDFTAPLPQDVDSNIRDDAIIFNWGGVRIVKLSPSLVVKYGAHVTIAEAKTMLFVAQHAEKPSLLPRIYAYYSFGPLSRDVDDYGSDYDTYIFMDFVEGQSLNTVWESYDQSTKASVAVQLHDFVSDLRRLAQPKEEGEPYIGGVGRAPVPDPILENFDAKGPFESEEAFNTTLIRAYQKQIPKCHIRKFLSGMLSEHNHHRIVFTHGDLRPQNIIVKAGVVTGIVDWELSGWYPEYWEFCKALYVWHWQNDWGDFLSEILQPYFSQFAIYSYLTAVLC